MPVKIETKKAGRVPSTIQFPYTDMSDAIAVAEGLLKGGGTAMSRDQLAAAMDLAPGGGTFATKVSTARIFGVMDATAGKYQLSELGFEIMDPGRQQEAKIKAFLSVELFKRVYDEFRGKLLPPRPHGLEAAFVTFGVTAKNARFARVAFEKSARLAGMYPGGNEDRLVMPFGGGVMAAIDRTFPDAGQPNTVEVAEPIRVAKVIDEPDIHPSIMGMVKELPPAKSDWSMAEQADWLRAMATMFRVIYKPTDAGAIDIKFDEQPPPFRRHPPE